MVHIIGILCVALPLFPLLSALPIQHTKRIAQVIDQSTADWEKACLAAGGADQCNPLSQTAFTSLLAAGGNCDQQDAADAMIDLAKTLNSDSEMIRLTQLFVQQPRNAPDSLQVPYCQSAPKNSELDGLFHCQFAGSDFSTFSGDQTGNVPLGLDAVTPPGSCPAKTDGPVADGVQLNTLVTDPGVGSDTGSSSASSSSDTDSSSSDGCATGTVIVTMTVQPTATSASPVVSPVASASSAAPAAASSSVDFVLQNGLDAIKLNDQFAGLTVSSTCTDGDQACISGDDGGFAQCVGGKFVVSACGSGTQCFALPLVNSPGTSLTCTTAADKEARIAASGAQD